MKKPPKPSVGKTGVAMAACNLIVAADVLQLLAGNIESGGDLEGSWAKKTSAERVKILAQAIQDAANAQHILMQALNNQLEAKD
jgi:hypothetical protein